MYLQTILAEKVLCKRIWTMITSGRKSIIIISMGCTVGSPYILSFPPMPIKPCPIVFGFSVGNLLFHSCAQGQNILKLSSSESSWEFHPREVCYPILFQSSTKIFVAHNNNILISYPRVDQLTCISSTLCSHLCLHATVI